MIQKDREKRIHWEELRNHEKVQSVLAEKNIMNTKFGDNTVKEISLTKSKLIAMCQEQQQQCSEVCLVFLFDEEDQLGKMNELKELQDNKDNDSIFKLKLSAIGEHEVNLS